MQISQPRERLVTLTGQTATVSAFATYMPHPAAQGVSLFAYVDVPGQLLIFRLDTDNVEQLLESTATNADILSVSTWAFNPGPLRVEFIPSSGPATGTIEASYYGHGGGVS